VYQWAQDRSSGDGLTAAAHMDFFGFVPLGVATATQQFAEPRIVLFSVVLAAVVAAAVWGVVLRPQPAAELFFRWIGGPNNGQRDLLNKVLASPPLAGTPRYTTLETGYPRS
jgi:hypothetical protein